MFFPVQWDQGAVPLVSSTSSGAAVSALKEIEA